MLKSASRNGYSLFQMEDPYFDRALSFRRVYLYPFWQIENTDKRWEWHTAKAAFNPDSVDASKAQKFADAYRKQLFGKDITIRNDGYILIPLQGRLLYQRSFQSMSPIEMIKTTLNYCKDKPVIASLHPSETYTTEETAELDRITKQNSRFSYVTAGSEKLLTGCDFVVTQNSSVAFSGYFLHKPALLFGQIDFHHIAINLWGGNAEYAFDQIKSTAPEYDKYLYWMLKQMSIDASSNTAPQKILSAFRRGGWDI